MLQCMVFSVLTGFHRPSPVSGLLVAPTAFLLKEGVVALLKASPICSDGSCGHWCFSHNRSSNKPRQQCCGPWCWCWSLSLPSGHWWFGNGGGSGGGDVGLPSWYSHLRCCFAAAVVVAGFTAGVATTFLFWGFVQGPQSPVVQPALQPLAWSPRQFVFSEDLIFSSGFSGDRNLGNARSFFPI